MAEVPPRMVRQPAAPVDAEPSRKRSSTQAQIGTASQQDREDRRIEAQNRSESPGREPAD